MSGEIDEITRAYRMAQRARADAFKLPTIEEMRPIVEAWESLPGMPYPSTMTTAQWRAVLVGDDICAQMREVVGAADRLADMMRDASAPEAGRDLGNEMAREGADRCHCGSKYWERDHCVDCGASIRALLADPAWVAANRSEGH